MTNKNYEKGVRFERKIVNEAKKLGFYALEVKNKNSPIDVVLINPKTKIIWFIQAKKKKGSQKPSKRVRDAFNYLSNTYTCQFDYVCSNEDLYDIIEIMSFCKFYDKNTRKCTRNHYNIHLNKKCPFKGNVLRCKEK